MAIPDQPRIRQNDEAGMNKHTCPCFVPGYSGEWTDRADIGVTDHFWEVSRMRCAQCGTPWLRAFLEHEAFSRSGRYYRMPVTDAALEALTPDAAVCMIETVAFRIAGGSRFDGMEHVISGQCSLLEAP